MSDNKESRQLLRFFPCRLRVSAVPGIANRTQCPVYTVAGGVNPEMCLHPITALHFIYTSPAGGAAAAHLKGEVRHFVGAQGPLKRGRLRFYISICSDARPRTWPRVSRGRLWPLNPQHFARSGVKAAFPAGAHQRRDEAPGAGARGRPA
ncbi:hypothetical protein NDU88_003990 [Pleurodeles waltl]|uniref:Uncharacterized protein n=1 Tax=Pleurodeles waltl TaxID=8319 RepID=A0AAV7V001_PLEWA|nr:hypothetical protein NDU88_003990 [Pleurodeles waltl]